MRSPRHQLSAARRNVRVTERTDGDRASAERLLGTTHPLAAVLRRFDLALEALVAVTAAQAAGVVFLSGGSRFGLSLAVAGLVVQVALCLRLADCRARLRELCLELIVVGRERLPLACIERERRRLLDSRTSRQLARSIEEMLRVAADPTRVPVRTRPLFSVGVIRAVAPELRQVATLLRGEDARVRGVAAVERLLSSPATPLYGFRVEPLRQELGRARYLLSLEP